MTLRESLQGLRKREKKAPQDTPRRVQQVTTDNKPLLVEVLAYENRDFGRDLFKAQEAAKKARATLTYEEEARIPHDLRKRFGDIAETNADLRRSVAEAMMEGKHVVGANREDVERVHDEVRDMMKFTTNSEDPQVQEAVDALNNNPKFVEERRSYGMERLVRDVPAGESSKVKWLTGIALVAAGAAGGANMLGAEGPAMAIGGQADDTLNFLSILFTKRSGEWKKKALIGGTVILGAMALDAFMLPGLFASAGTAITLAAASGLYWLTATAGSMAGEMLEFFDNLKAVKRLDRLNNLPGRENAEDEHLRQLRHNKKFQREIRKLKPEEAKDRIMDKVSALEGDAKEGTMSEVTALLAKDPTGVALKEAVTRLNLLDRIKLAGAETLANPYRSWLFKGLGVSFVASLGAGALGLLPGKGLLTAAFQTIPTVRHFAVGLTEAIIGPIESLTAIFGSQRDGRLYDKKRNRQLKKRLRKAKGE